VCEDAGVADGTVGRVRAERPSLVGVGTVVWLASELMFFGGLFAAYFTLRGDARVWPPPGVHLETLAAVLATAVLLLSSGTMILATRAMERGEEVLAQRWLVVTLALGAVFLANQVREFFVLGFSASSSGYGSMYYLMTGFHGMHVLGGLVLILVAVVMVAGARDAEDRRPLVESVSYYWHFVDVVWILVFSTLFFVR
jgi:cytochrome c oxidase subunit 3